MLSVIYCEREETLKFGGKEIQKLMILCTQNTEEFFMNTSKSTDQIANLRFA